MQQKRKRKFIDYKMSLQSSIRKIRSRPILALVAIIGIFAISFYLMQYTLFVANVQTRIYNKEFASALQQPFLPKPIGWQMVLPKETREEKPASTVIFDLNVSLKSSGISKMKVYRSKPQLQSKTEAEFFSGLFALKTDIMEAVQEYSIQDQDQTLIISKEQGLIQYKKAVSEKGSTTVMSEKEAQEQVCQFFLDLAIPLHYDTIAVDHIPSEKRYHVCFINTVEGKKNYSYCKSASIGYDGVIQAINLYDIRYEQIGVYRIKTASQAFEELQSMSFNVPDHTMIDIKEVELVYYQFAHTQQEGSDTYLQPAYRFVGEIQGQKGLEVFIPAVKEEFFR